MHSGYLTKIVMARLEYVCLFESLLLNSIDDIEANYRGNDVNPLLKLTGQELDILKNSEIFSHSGLTREGMKKLLNDKEKQVLPDVISLKLKYAFEHVQRFGEVSTFWNSPVSMTFEGVAVRVGNGKSFLIMHDIFRVQAFNVSGFKRLEKPICWSSRWCSI